jgi:hypothetical protein
MSPFSPLPIIILFLCLGFILFALSGIITWSIRVSCRFNGVETPKTKRLFAVGFLQILLGVLTVFAIKAIKDEPLPAIGTGFGITFLSGLFFLKLILKNQWKSCLRLWGIAALLQLVLLPVSAAILLVVFVFLISLLFPPVY